MDNQTVVAHSTPPRAACRVDGAPVRCLAATYAGAARAPAAQQTARGPLVPGGALCAAPADPAPLAGQVVAAERGDCSFARKAEVARAAGAAALLIRTPSRGGLLPPPVGGAGGDVALPVAMVVAALAPDGADVELHFEPGGGCDAHECMYDVNARVWCCGEWAFACPEPCPLPQPPPPGETYFANDTARWLRPFNSPRDESVWIAPGRHDAELEEGCRVEPEPFPDTVARCPWRDGLPRSPWPARAFDVAVHTMFRNGAARLPEWLRYHELLGVGHFFLYDHGSDDGSREALQPFVDRGLVTLEPWPHMPEQGQEKNSIQRAAFNHALLKHGHAARWLGVFDLDEFLDLGPHGDVRELLRGRRRSARVSSQFFGSGDPDPGPGESMTRGEFATFTDGLVLERFTAAAHAVVPDGRQKLFWRVATTPLIWNVHSGDFGGHEDVPPSEARFAHFWVGRKWPRQALALPPHEDRAFAWALPYLGGGSSLGEPFPEPRVAGWSELEVDARGDVVGLGEEAEEDEDEL